MFGLTDLFLHDSLFTYHTFIISISLFHKNHLQCCIKCERENLRNEQHLPKDTDGRLLSRA